MARTQSRTPSQTGLSRPTHWMNESMPRLYYQSIQVYVKGYRIARDGVWRSCDESLGLYQGTALWKTPMRATIIFLVSPKYMDRVLRPLTRAIVTRIPMQNPTSILEESIVYHGKHPREGTDLKQNSPVRLHGSLTSRQPDVARAA